jgi:hypothetical protein
MLIPQTWQTLEKFCNWYKLNNYPIRVPENATVYVTDTTYSCCLFRQDVYQVELYLCKPNFETEFHSHPFDQITIYLGGQMSGQKQNEEPGQFGSFNNFTSLNTESPNFYFGTIGSLLLADHDHKIQCFDRGAIFLSLQKWPDHAQMTGAAVMFNGPTVGSLHESLIKQSKQ